MRTRSRMPTSPWPSGAPPQTARPLLVLGLPPPRPPLACALALEVVAEDPRRAEQAVVVGDVAELDAPVVPPIGQEVDRQEQRGSRAAQHRQRPRRVAGDGEHRDQDREGAQELVREAGQDVAERCHAGDHEDWERPAPAQADRQRGREQGRGVEPQRIALAVAPPLLEDPPAATAAARAQSTRSSRDHVRGTGRW